MPLKAKRNGTTVSLPRYCNAEMLMLEFFKGDLIGIKPLGAKQNSPTYINVEVNVHVDILDQLLTYINDNI